MVADEHRPVTIEDVISPVPMNPSFISEKAKWVEIRSVLAIVDFRRVVGNPYLGIASLVGQAEHHSSTSESVSTFIFIFSSLRHLPSNKE